jgi:hypothetical protein
MIKERERMLMRRGSATKRGTRINKEGTVCGDRRIEGRHSNANCAQENRPEPKHSRERGTSVIAKAFVCAPTGGETWRSHPENDAAEGSSKTTEGAALPFTRQRKKAASAELAKRKIPYEEEAAEFLRTLAKVRSNLPEEENTA